MVAMYKLFRGWQGRCIARYQLAQHGSSLHFAEHVEVVVAGSAVCAQRHINALV